MTYGQRPEQHERQGEQEGGDGRWPRGKSWPGRHKTLTGIFAFVALIIVAANSGCSPSSPGGDTPTGLSTTPSATATAPPSRQAVPSVATTQKAHPKPAQTTSATSQAPVPPPPAPTTPAPAPTTAASV